MPLKLGSATISLGGMAKAMLGTVQAWAGSAVEYINRVSPNSDFTATTGWSGSGATISASGGNLLVTSNGLANYARANVTSSAAYAEGKVIYLRVTFEVDSAVCTKVDTIINNISADLKSAPAANTEYTLSRLYTLGATGSGNVPIAIRHYYADAATCNGKILTIKQIMFIDCTTDGLAAYSKEQLDALPFVA